MKKRKKKNRNQQQKQESRHHRNEFFKRLRQVMALLGDASAFKLLDKVDRRLVFDCRLRPLKIIVPKEMGHFPDKLLTLKQINLVLSYLLKKTYVDVGQARLSLYDFTVYVETLQLQWHNMPENHPEIADRFRACFPLFDTDFMEIRFKANKLIDQKLQEIAYLFSDLSSHVIRFVPEKIEKPASFPDNSAFFNNYILDVKKPEIEAVKIDGHTRPVYQLLLNFGQEFNLLTITPEKLGITGIMQKFPLKIYMQQHAFDRIELRLGKQLRRYNYLYIIPAILVNEPIPVAEKTSYLFPVTNANIKLGYLKGDIIGDKLVIRTSLFLTHNGTPEGKRLQELAGIQKADKQYLGIDKLTTFIFSDIKKNEKLKALFCEAGCGDLFRIKKNVLDDPDRKDIACADLLTRYLGMNSEGF
jgi:hypothetical protein